MLTLFRMHENALEKLDEPAPGCLINLIDPTHEEMERVRSFLPAIEQDDFASAYDQDEISRFEVRRTYTFLVLNAPMREKRGRSGKHRTYPLVIMAFEDDTTVVASRADLHLFGSTLREARRVLPRAHSTRYLREVLMTVALTYQEYLHDIETARAEVMDRLERRPAPNDLLLLHGLETDIVYFETALSANCAMLRRAVKSPRFRMDDDEEESFSDILVEFDQASETAHIYRQLVGSTRELLSDVMSGNLETTMKVLTSITILLAIPTVISGFYGMNTATAGMPPAQSTFGFIAIVAATCVLCILVAWILRKRGLL